MKKIGLFFLLVFCAINGVQAQIIGNTVSTLTSWIIPDEVKSEFHWYVAAGKTDEAKRLLRRAVSSTVLTNAAVKDNWTPLMAAVTVGNLEMAKFLVANGAFVNTQTHRELISPLCIAVKNGDVQMVEFLLNNNAHVDQACEGQYGTHMHGTPLEIAIVNGAYPEIVDLLVSHGAWINEKDNQGYTPLMLVAMHTPHKEVLDKTSIDNYVKSAEILLDAGAEVNIKDDDGATAAFFALQDQSKKELAALPMIKLLIERQGAILADEIDKDYEGSVIKYVEANGGNEAQELSHYLQIAEYR